PTLIRFSRTQQATRSCSAAERRGAWAAMRGISRATIWSWSAPVSKSMFRVTRSMAARAISAMPYTEYSPARLALRASRSCSGAVHASARSRRARPSSAAGPGAGRGPALSWGGTLSVEAGEVTVHRLGPRSDKDPNEADAPGRHGCRTEHGHGARSPGTPRHGAPSLDPQRSPPGPGG